MVVGTRAIVCSPHLGRPIRPRVRLAHSVGVTAPALKLPATQTPAPPRLANKGPPRSHGIWGSEVRSWSAAAILLAQVGLHMSI